MAYLKCDYNKQLYYWTIYSFTQKFHFRYFLYPNIWKLCDFFSFSISSRIFKGVLSCFFIFIRFAHFEIQYKVTYIWCNCYPFYCIKTGLIVILNTPLNVAGTVGRALCAIVFLSQEKYAWMHMHDCHCDVVSFKTQRPLEVLVT